MTRVVVVVGWSAGLVARALPPGVEVLSAPCWSCQTQADSVRLALAVLPRGPVLVQPVDIPPPCSATLRALLGAGGSAVPCFEGRRGHPVLLGEDAVDRLSRECPAEGLRGVLADAMEVEVADPGVTWNLNNPRALARWLKAGPWSSGPRVKDHE